MTSEVDFIVIGQGIAGSMVAYRLQQAGYSFLIYDEQGPNASKASAGIINPITGRSFVKSWLFDHLFLEAKKTYLALETELQIDIWNELPLYRTIHTVQEENRISERMQSLDYQTHLDKICYLPDITGFRSQLLKLSCLKIRAARCRLQLLLEALRSKWREDSKLHEERFDFGDVVFKNSEGIRYRDVAANYIVCCQGHQGNDNRYFDAVPLKGYYGQAALVKDLDWPAYMFKNRQFVAPWSSDTAWFGSANSHGSYSRSIRQEATLTLKKALTDWFGSSGNISSILEGIRPTTPDRRPIVGRHPLYPELLFFNGLGTKGASLAPWLSLVFLQWIQDQMQLPKEVMLARFPGFF